MLTNRGPALALAALFVIAVYGVSLSSRPHQNSNTIAKGNDPPHITPPESAEERIADYTWWLSCFTLALVVISTFQISFLIRADKTARITADAAKLSAEAAIGVVLPKLLISNIYFHDTSNPDIPSLRKVIVKVTNYGRTPAFVFRETAEMRIMPMLPSSPDYRNLVDLMPAMVIESRDTYDITARLQDLTSFIDYPRLLERKEKMWV